MVCYIPLLLLLTACVSPSPTPPSIHLMADGSGDYATLPEAVENAPADAAIFLGPGVYRLTQPLVVNQALHLIGAGMDQTEIVAGTGDYVLLFDGEGPFAVEGITFRHDGEEADVVVVAGGQIAFANCRFTGAAKAAGGTGGAGLLLRGATRGTVENCQAIYNNHTGILVRDEAQVMLTGNACSNNEGAGIAFINSSGGTARQNRCLENGLGGILVAGEARPILEENVCNNNGDSGIAYFDGGGGLAQRNECSNNGQYGIFIISTANPDLVGNECRHNVKADIQDERR